MNKRLKLLLNPFEAEVKAKLYKYHLAISFGVFLCIAPFFTKLNSTLGGICLVILGNGLYLLLFYFVNKREGKIQQELVDEKSVGFIQLDNNKLCIEYQEEQSILGKGTDTSVRFDYFGARGETEGYIKFLKYTQYSETFYGTSNYLTISTSPDKKIYIYLHDDNDVEIYNNIIMWCYKNGIPIDEFCRGERVYGGQKLKYKEIQEFKEKYHNR